MTLRFSLIYFIQQGRHLYVKRFEVNNVASVCGKSLSKSCKYVRYFYSNWSNLKFFQILFFILGQLADWTSQLYRNKHVTSPLKESLGASLKVFKDSGNWKEASMWGKLVMVKWKEKYFLVYLFFISSLRKYISLKHNVYFILNTIKTVNFVTMPEKRLHFISNFISEKCHKTYSFYGCLYNSVNLMFNACIQ